MTSTRKCIFESEACLARYKIVIKLADILQDQKVFWRINGLSEDKEKLRQIEQSNEGMTNSERRFFFYNWTWCSGVIMRMSNIIVKIKSQISVAPEPERKQ